MFGLSLSHWIIVLVVVLLFGSRRLPELGLALGKGILAFKKGLQGEDNPSQLVEKKPDEDHPSNS